MNYSKAVKTALIASLFVGGVSSALANPASSSSVPGHRIKGVYVDLLAGYGGYKLSNDSYKTSNDGFIGTLNLGYQFNRNFALEIGGGYSLRISGKFLLPVDKCTDVYAKAGVGYAFIQEKRRTTTYTSYGTVSTSSVEETKGKVVGSVGVGGTHWLNSRWGITAEAMYLTNSIGSSSDAASAYEATVGVSYHW